jgi:L-alanine-DL-glutamate epimerase-like enolase superfamily enzyme
VGYAPGPPHEAARDRVEQVIAPFLEGRTLREPDALRILFGGRPDVTPADVRLYSAVEIALHDLTGQALGVPVSELLGGRVRNGIRLYGSAGMYMPPEAYAEEAGAVLDAGFQAYKFRPGLGVDRDVAVMEKVRQAAGPDADLMVDAHTWWRMGDLSYREEQVRLLAAEAGRLGMTWLEEPLPPLDHAAYVLLNEEDLVPLAAGEHEPDGQGFADLIANRAAAYLQMDLVCQGGYLAGRGLLADLERAGLEFAFHSWGTDLEVAAAAQLGVCFPESVAGWLEYPVYRTADTPVMYEFPLAREILAEPLDLRRGLLQLDPKRPGLGVRVDEAVFDRYPWIPGPWSYFRMESPAQTWAVVGDHSVVWA